MGFCLKKFLGFTSLLAGLAFCGAGLWLLLSPAQYRAKAIIKIEQDAPDINGIQGQDVSYDPYFIQTDFEIIQSQLVLGKVISTLNLNVAWGKKYSGGTTLTTNATIAILKRHLNLAPVRNTRLIEISFTSEDPNEAATIANAIAKAYRDFRQERHRQQILPGIQVLTEEYKHEEEQIRVAKTNLDLLRYKYKINKSQEIDFEQPSTLLQQLSSPEEREKSQKEYERTKPFWEEKRKFASMVEFHKLLAVKIEDEKVDDDHGPTLPVTFVDVAMPPKYPIGPNRWLGGALLVMGIFQTIGGWLLIKASRHRRLSA